MQAVQVTILSCSFACTTIPITTAIANEHMENALSLLPQRYTADDLATIVKNVLRNVKTNGNGNIKAKTAKTLLKHC